MSTDGKFPHYWDAILFLWYSNKYPRWIGDLSALSRRTIFKLVKLRGRDGASMVTTGENGALITFLCLI